MDKQDFLVQTRILLAKRRYVHIQTKYDESGSDILCNIFFLNCVKCQEGSKQLEVNPYVKQFH